jgi:hypothetical protein
MDPTIGQLYREAVRAGEETGLLSSGDARVVGALVSDINTIRFAPRGLAIALPLIRRYN